MPLHTTLHRVSLIRAVLLAGMLLVSLLGSRADASTGGIPLAESGGSGGVSGNQGAVYRLFQEVFGGRAAAGADLIADGALIHTPGGEFRGAAGLNDFVASLRAPFTEATFTVHDMVAEGNTVHVRWTMRAIITAGAPIVVEGLSVLQFDRGTIAETWMSYDRMALAQQIQAASYTNMENARSEALPVLGAVAAPIAWPDPRTPD